MNWNKFVNSNLHVNQLEVSVFREHAGMGERCRRELQVEVDVS